MNEDIASRLRSACCEAGPCVRAADDRDDICSNADMRREAAATIERLTAECERQYGIAKRALAATEAAEARCKVMEAALRERVLAALSETHAAALDMLEALECIHAITENPEVRELALKAIENAGGCAMTLAQAKQEPVT